MEAEIDDNNQHISNWVWDFLLKRASLEDDALNSLITILPPPKHNPNIPKFLILTKLQSYVSQNHIPESALDLLEQLEEIGFRQGVGASNAMKRAYCAVAVDCTVRQSSDEFEYFECVKRIWRNKVGAMEKVLGKEGGLGSAELWEWRDKFEIALWENGVSKSMVETSDGAVDAVEAVSGYVMKERGKMGPTFLEMLVERVQGDDVIKEKLGLGEVAAASVRVGLDRKGDDNVIKEKVGVVDACRGGGATSDGVGLDGKEGGEGNEGPKERIGDDNVIKEKLDLGSAGGEVGATSDGVCLDGNGGEGNEGPKERIRDANVVKENLVLGSARGEVGEASGCVALDAKGGESNEGHKERNHRRRVYKRRRGVEITDCDDEMNVGPSNVVDSTDGTASTPRPCKLMRSVESYDIRVAEAIRKRARVHDNRVESCVPSKLLRVDGYGVVHHARRNASNAVRKSSEETNALPDTSREQLPSNMVKIRSRLLDKSRETSSDVNNMQGKSSDETNAHADTSLENLPLNGDDLRSRLLDKSRETPSDVNKMQGKSSDEANAHADTSLENLPLNGDELRSRLLDKSRETPSDENNMQGKTVKETNARADTPQENLPVNRDNHSPGRRKMQVPVSIQDFENLKGKPKRRWNAEEQDTLRNAVYKFGEGNWKLIQQAYGDVFKGRTNVDLKDKWRNMIRSGNS